jgi:hypothetical protein
VFNKERHVIQSGSPTQPTTVQTTGNLLWRWFWKTYDYKTGSGLDDWIYCTLYTTPRNYRQYSTIAILHSSQFTVPHALGFSVFTSRILVTDWSQSHCNFKSHVKSCHSLISFLPLFCNC